PKYIWPSAPMFQRRAENGIAAASPVRIRRLAIMTVWPMLNRLPSAPDTRPRAALHGFAPSPASTAAMTPSVSATATIVPASERRVVSCRTAIDLKARLTALTYATSATGADVWLPAIASATPDSDTDAT